jgi:non-heme chloroperoxidase
VAVAREIRASPIDSPPSAIGAAAMQSSKLIPNAKLTVYAGGDHGMCSTRKDRVNADLLEFRS